MIRKFTKRGIDVTAYFWQRVQKGPDCWIWAGSIDNSGYGTLGLVGTIGLLAHRVSYELAYGPIPSGTRIGHTCLNTLCVNPEHLYLRIKQDAERNRVLRRRAAKLATKDRQK